MTSNVVQLAPDGSGKMVDTSELLVGSNTVQRQRVVIGDDSDPAGLAEVRSTNPANSDPGLVTREVLAPELRDLAEAVAFLATCIHDRLPMSDSQERLRVFLDSSNGGNANLMLTGIANTGQTTYLQMAPYNFMAMDSARLYQQLEVS